MKRFLIPLLAAFALPISAQANVDPKIHRICLKATDYAGCVKIQTEGSSASTQMIIQEDASISEGNACPDSYAYFGSGVCQLVYCDIKGMRLFAKGHDPRLGGKGWVCEPRFDYAGGSLRFSTISPVISASFDKRCPSEEPEIGRNNSCQNGLSERQIKDAFHPPIGMGKNL